MNTIVNTLHRYWRWHPKIALRYLPLVDAINRIDRRGSILEIGSGALGIAPYLGRPITGLDLDFIGPSYPDIIKIRGDAMRVPFADDTFDFVILMDVLEHIPPHDRARVVEEAVRVTRKALFIGVPCGEEAMRQDEWLDKEYKKKIGQRFSYLREHITYGLPKQREVVSFIKNGTDKIQKSIKNLEIRPNLNIQLRGILMRGWMTKNPIIDFFFRKCLLFFIPVLRCCNWNPVYRQLFIVTLSV